MRNTSFCQSCDTFKKTREVTVLGKQLTVKNYICSADGIHYREKPENVKLQLTICPTSFCSASCPFCIARNIKEKKFVDLKKLESCLRRLNDEKIVRGISFTGGEPFTDVKLLNDILNMVFDIFGLNMEVSVTTNGFNLQRMYDIDRLSYLDALHISRHHYDEEINRSFFGIPMPTNGELKEILHSVSYRDLFVLNCMLLKDYIGTVAQAHKFMDFAIEAGARKVAFITCTPINDYARAETLDYTDVLCEDDPEIMFTRGFFDFDVCRCRDGVYVSPTGEIIEFYGRSTGDCEVNYTRGLVYGADNHLRSGYNGEIIF